MTYGQRPSEIIRLETQIGAWTLDETCLMVGRQIEKALHNGEDPFGDISDSRVKGQRAFSSVTSTASAKRMKIPDNGVW